MKRIILTGSVSLLSLFAAGAASAQQAPTDSAPSGAVQPAPGDNGQDDVIVTGIRASQQASIDAKRNSSIIADIISAEDIGKFPDKNVAEALQRVPGIVINREFGEGERVSLRGTAPNLTKTLINGHGIATADWFILEQLSATRSFNYLTLPAEIVGQLDVYKSSQADVEEGGIGGTINVHTRHPLDLPRWSLSAAAQAVYSERSDKFDPQASGLVSWKNDAETFGVLLGGVYQKRRIRRDGLEILGYQTATSTTGQTAQIGALMGSALFQQERERYGGNLELQFRPSDNVEIVATGLYSRFNADNSNQNYLAWTSNALGGGGTLTNATVQDGTFVKGTVTSTPGGRAVVYDTFYREAYAETWSGDLDLTLRTGSDGVLHLKGGYTRAVGRTGNQFLDEGGAPGAFTFDITGRAPQVSFTGVRPTVANDLAFDFANVTTAGNVDREKYAYLDFEQPLDGPLAAIKVGGKYTDHDRSSTLTQTTYGSFFLPLAATGCGGRACTSADFAGGSLPSDYLGNIALAGTLRNYYNVDTAKLRQILLGQPAATLAQIENPPFNYSINEKTYGGYVMVKVGQPGVTTYHANIGLRVVRTEQTSRGNLLGVPASTPGAVTGNAFGVFAPITVKRSYTDILPAINVWFDLDPQLVLRFGAGRTIARPDYTDIVPRVNLNVGSLTGDGGDPSVNRYESDDVNASLEWYPDRETIVAGALYYKQIASYIVNRTVQQTFPVQTTTPNLSRCTPAAGFSPTNPLYNCLFDINRRSNGSGGRNVGVELQLSRRLFGPFGVIASYTYSDAKSDAGDPIPGNSKHSLNATGYFENDWLSLRLSYNYRSKWFIDIDRAAPQNQDNTESLDFSGNLQLTDNIALTADAVNLTNAKIRQYSGTETRFLRLYDNGRIFYAGVRVKF